MSPSRPVDCSVPAVVLKLVPDAYAHGRLGAVRSLGRLGVPVYHLDETPMTPAGRTRYGTRVPWVMERTPVSGTGPVREHISRSGAWERLYYDELGLLERKETEEAKALASRCRDVR